MAGFRMDDKSRISILNCSFIGCNVDGRPMATDRPVIMGDPKLGNVAFPSGWSSQDVKEWRALMDMLPRPKWRTPIVPRDNAA